MAFAKLNNLTPFESAGDFAKPGEEKVSLERSESEKEAIEALEDDPSLKTQNNQNDTPAEPEKTSSGKNEANVLLTNAGISNGTVSASGFVTNLVEDGGDCSYKFTNGSSSVVKTSKTLMNPTSTTCETVSFPASELTSGNWKVVLSYSSSASTGASSQKEFTK